MSRVDAADFYTGLVAQAYAALRSSVFDAGTYAAFVREHGEPGLEVGCGDGDPLLELVAQGLDVDGVDSSPDMIDRAAAAAAARGLAVGLHVARMERMDLPRRYRSIYLAGPTFELLPDDALALQALRAFRRHLAPGGTVLVPLWIAGPTPAAELGVAREAVGADGARLRFTPLSETYDPDARLRRTAVRYERVPVAGEVEVLDREWVIHWQTLSSITGLAAAAGLTVSRVTGGSDAAGQVGDEFTVHLTATGSLDGDDR